MNIINPKIRGFSRFQNVEKKLLFKKATLPKKEDKFEHMSKIEYINTLVFKRRHIHVSTIFEFVYFLSIKKASRWD